MFSLPRRIKPSTVLPVMRQMATVLDSDAYAPLLNAMTDVVVSEGINDLRYDEIKRSRVSSLPQNEQLRVYFLKFLRKLTTMDRHEIWFVTIDLTEAEYASRPSEVVNSLFKRMAISPHWVGVNVPLNGNPHLHFACAVPARLDLVKRLASFVERRNKIKHQQVPRSAYIRDVFYIQGLFDYFCRDRNLGIPGAKVIASRSVKAR